jgi:chemotaxis-related protein WspD
MTPSIESRADGLDCWSRIGIAGDRSCPELEQFIHCRNCPVFSRAAGGFFDRPAPAGYLDEWARQLAAPVEPPVSNDVSLLIFRLGREWLAVRSQIVVEVTEPRPVHRIPHRSNETLVGMVNLRGQLQLQVSMHGLLGVGERVIASASGAASRPRLVVIKREGQTWVFEVDEVSGVERFSRGRLGGVPSTLANPANSFSQAVFNWREVSVGYLDDQRLFAALKELGQ